MWTSLLVLGICAGVSSGANILAMFPMPTYSHTHGYLPILEELALRGHNVTVVSPFPRKQPLANYTDITIENPIPESIDWGVMTPEIANSFSSVLKGYTYYCHHFLDPLFSNPKLMDFINNDRSHFDLVITETFFCQESFTALAHKYSAHLIAVHPFMLGSREAYYTGNTLPYSYVPQANVDSSDEMSFYFRAYSSLLHFSQLVLNYFLFENTMERYMRDNFKYPGSERLPPIRELLTNHSLIMLDFHTSLSFPRPYLQNVVEFGGLTIKKAGPLPKDLEEFMAGAEHGVIYLSWGSYFKSSTIKREILHKFLSVFSKLKQRVLMKWEDDELPGKPENVRISKWLPQTTILAHPKLLVFISHCGIHGLNEGAHYGVPTLATPIIYDQFQNARVVEKVGYGIYLDINHFTEEFLLDSIQKLINDPSYKEAAIRRSRILRDLPIPKLNNTIYWVEYVLRHDGARHLRPASLDLAWYQYFLLDVIGLALLCLGALLSLPLYICWFCCCKRSERKTLKKKKKSKKD